MVMAIYGESLKTWKSVRKHLLGTQFAANFRFFHFLISPGFTINCALVNKTSSKTIGHLYKHDSYHLRDTEPKRFRK